MATARSGSHKWDIDGNEYIDYYGGHGSLILGHQHPQVLEAIQAQLGKGMHLAAANELEVEWARAHHGRWCQSAERVRFTSSGTEATQLAMRLARAATGRPRIVRFQTHFHGWHDQVSFGVHEHSTARPSVGVLPEVADEHDARRAERRRGGRARLARAQGRRGGDDRAGRQQLRARSRRLRKCSVRCARSRASTARCSIFDEVVTGFRVRPAARRRFTA